MLKNFLLAFIPIFVAVDAVGTLPIFIGLTERLKSKEKKKVIWQSLVTAFLLAVGFIFLGRGIFALLGITMGDFMVAGGIILMCIAVMDLLKPGKERREPHPDMGAVPIGTPLIVGPAVLTTSLMLIGQYGLLPTLLAVLVNILIAGMIFWSSERLIKVLGQAGSRALSKVMALLLSAIAVMMIRKGITFLITQGFFIP